MWQESEKEKTAYHEAVDGLGAEGLLLDDLYTEHETGYGHPERPERVEALVLASPFFAFADPTGYLFRLPFGMDAVERAGALLVTGSSLMVFSGFRFARHADATGTPIAIVNQGRTRADDLAALRIDADCSEVLPQAAAAVTATPQADVEVLMVLHSFLTELGFDDLGTMWRSAYDMDPADFPGELDKLWEQVSPLYEALHCHVRARLAEAYGIKALRIRRPADIDRKLREARSYDDGPCVVVAEVIREDNGFPWVPAGAPVSAMMLEPPKEKLEKPSGST